ncbi:Uncharacterized conserved protein YbbC, DUF1343 family [Spirosomataceae bacterium TFI 002]|nr:Uncharacterized conserved protein YbbC, DUF1343 family [Spirosomataceae bacterium TFI 002]
MKYLSPQFRVVLVAFTIICLSSCKTKGNEIKTTEKITVGAERLDKYLPLVKGKKIGLVVNHTSTVGNSHLLDTLLSLGENVKGIYAPEHGFRGEASAGATIKDGKDGKTGIIVFSLYGKNKKPSPEMLAGIDVLIFDIQDVGARFYTYSSTLHYVMEAAGEQDIPLIVLDRPNPNGHYVAGPVLEKDFKSFVGLNPIPVVHGLTLGEMAQMINGEGWTKQHCDLTVIPCSNYDHKSKYEVPIKPSPNLPNNQSIYLYPSICFFEPTVISVGRGTDMQFQVIGGPLKAYGDFSFTPVDKPGAKDPVNEGVKCFGMDLRNSSAFEDKFTLDYLIDFYSKSTNPKGFFTNENFFNLLMGNNWVIQDIKAGKTAEQIQSKWEKPLAEYKLSRKKYLIYPDFE